MTLNNSINSQLNILSLNCNSIYNKLPELKNLLLDNKPDIMCLCETWLKDKYSPRFKNYITEWKNRSERGGGLGIIVKQTIQYQTVQLQDYQDGVLETQAIKIYMADSSTLFILNIYNPNKNVTIQEIEHYLNQLGDIYLIIGDLNAHTALLNSETRRSNQTGKTLENLLLQNTLCLINQSDIFTYIDRKTGKQSCLDVCLSSSNIAPLTDIEPFGEIGSDHLIMKVTIELNPVNYEWLKTPKYKITKQNLEKFKNSYIPPKQLRPGATNELAEDLIARITESANEAFGKPREPGDARKRTPWWTEECRSLVKERNKAYKTFSKHPTTPNWIAYKKATAKARNIIKDSKKKSLEEFVSSLTHNTPQSIVWRRIKSFKSGYTPQTFPLTSTDGPILSPKEKAQTFNKFFKEQVGDAPDERPYDDYIKQCYNKENKLLNRTINEDELNNVLYQLKNSSPGHDNISNTLLKNCSECYKDEILYLFNQSLARGEMPNSWKYGIIIPIVKPGKVNKHKESYRPITLLANIGKLLEKIMQKRKERHIELENKLSKYQYGFRPGKGTDDILLKLTSLIKETYDNKKACCVIYIDLKAAFDRVWRHGLIYKAAKLGITGCSLKWLKNYLDQRTQSAVVHGHYSDKLDSDCGVPQGGMLSPLLFNIMLQDIPLDDNVELFIFADDITVACTGDNTADIQKMMQDYLDRLTEWFEYWRFTVNSTKTKMQYFTRRRIVAPEITYQNVKLDQVKEQRLLGVILDAPYLSWKAHIDYLTVNCTKRIGIMRSLASVSHGASFSVLRMFYIAYIRARLTYGASSFISVSNTQMQRLSVIQNTCLRLMTGGRRTSPILSLEAEANIPPLNIYIEYLSAKKFIKLHFKPSEDCNADSLIKSTNIKERNMKIIQEYNLTKLKRTPIELYPPDSNLNERIILESIPPESFDQYCQCKFKEFEYIYTDGSVTETPEISASSGIYHANEKMATSWRIHPSHTVVASELFAILNALKYIEARPQDKWVIFSDSLTSLHMIQNNCKTYRETTDRIKIKMKTLLEKKSIFLHWVKGHAGITGNVIADKAANLGHQLTKSVIYNLHQEELLHLAFKGMRAKWDRYWHSEVNSTGKGWFLHSIRETILTKTPVDTGQRRTDIAAFRLRLGHAGLNKHLYKIKKSTTELCAFCNVEETIEHFIIDCDQYEYERGILYTEIIAAIHKLQPLTLKLVLGAENFAHSTNKIIIKALTNFLISTGRLCDI